MIERKSWGVCPPLPPSFLGKSMTTRAKAHYANLTAAIEIEPRNVPQHNRLLSERARISH
jgi:hypothetical protein